MIYGTGLLYIISFSLLAEADSVLMFVLVITLCSMATSLWRPLVSALIGDVLREPQTRELAMQSWYFVTNVGCAVGPMVGVWFGLTGQQSSFYITVMAFAILLVLLWWGFSQHNNKPNKGTIDEQLKPDTPNVKQAAQVTFRGTLIPIAFNS